MVAILSRPQFVKLDRGRNTKPTTDVHNRLCPVCYIIEVEVNRLSTNKLYTNTRYTNQDDRVYSA